jgi:hypothetical protein
MVRIPRRGANGEACNGSSLAAPWQNRDARQKVIKFKRQKRAIDALPQRAQRVVEGGRA